MQDREQFDAFLNLCEATYQRLKRDGKWRWRDSPDPEDMVESKDNPHHS